MSLSVLNPGMIELLPGMGHNADHVALHLTFTRLNVVLWAIDHLTDMPRTHITVASALFLLW